MIYNPNHQMVKKEEHSIKRELSPQLNSTPPPKKKKEMMEYQLYQLHHRPVDIHLLQRK
jgi:hypothetical protein